MRTVVNYYTAHQKDIEDATAKHWAGDCVLGNVFKAAGVKFTNSYPILQGHHPGTVPYAKPDGRSSEDDPMRLWCYPSVSYHHVTPKVVEDLWGFEQQWFASDRRVRHLPLLLVRCNTNILRHRMTQPFCDTRTSSIPIFYPRWPHLTRARAGITRATPTWA